MGAREIDQAKAAYKATLVARRDVVVKLGTANNSHNRAELLQILETLEALKGVIKDENSMD